MSQENSNLLPGIFKGSFLLITIVTLTYWLPFVLWLVKVLVTERTSFPYDLSFWNLIYRTLWISGIVAFISVISAYPIAIIWRLSNQLLQRIIVILMIIPLVMGLLARNYSWIGMLSNRDPIYSLGFSIILGTDSLYSIETVCIVMSSVFIPIAFFMIMQGLRAILSAHIDAARTLGMSEGKIVIYIILRMGFRSAVLAFGFILALSSGFFITPRMIGGGKYDFISNAILTFVNFGQFGQASIVAVAFLCIILLPLTLIMAYSLRIRKITMGQ